MPEAGRAIIQDQIDIGGGALPWDDREAFGTLMLAWEMRSYRDAVSASGPIIFDRGIPDVIGYLRRCGLPVPASVLRAAELRRYASRVFIAPPCLLVHCFGRLSKSVCFCRKPPFKRFNFNDGFVPGTRVRLYTGNGRPKVQISVFSARASASSTSIPR